jgi:hypothetical protein
MPFPTPSSPFRRDFRRLIGSSGGWGFGGKVYIAPRCRCFSRRTTLFSLKAGQPRGILPSRGLVAANWWRSRSDPCRRNRNLAAEYERADRCIHYSWPRQPLLPIVRSSPYRWWPTIRPALEELAAMAVYTGEAERSRSGVETPCAMAFVLGTPVSWIP